MKDNKKNKIEQPVTNPIVIGKIVGAYGVLGWIRIISFTEKSDNIFFYNPYYVIIQSKWKSIYLDKWRLLGKRYIAKMREISNRESAQLLNHCEMIIDKTRLPHLNTDEYYWKDLIGCTVITVKGIFLGNIISMIETTANDVLVVKMYQNKFAGIRNCLIPFLIKRVIKNVDLVIRTVTVDWDPNF
ncbi:ribosome maturation factor RimM [Candidatus Blochmannia vicinus]|uniref:Ribosome maturation factor RimM n=1 Tax=Candidatus Blochmannia vicinus (nom. nud.) TaxID=251540 RepID=A0ABY4SX06_9ENTR|nr:ribosome maturation factor RimM [Candidatus Blochmannia vicinus]URJ32866.1 ribosome maturation factor RimM [Candidatus Blochmannia vicinus]